MVTVRNGYITITMAGAKVGDAATMVASKISQKKGRKPGDPLVHFMRPEGLPAVPGANNLLRIINETTSIAKERWSEANAIVLRHTAIEQEMREEMTRPPFVPGSIRGPGSAAGSVALDEIVQPGPQSVAGSALSSAGSAKWTHNPYDNQSNASSGAHRPFERRRLPTVPRPENGSQPPPDYELVPSLPLANTSTGKLRGHNIYLGKNTPVRVPIDIQACSSFLWSDAATPVRISEFQACAPKLLTMESSKGTVKLINQDFRTVEHEMMTHLFFVAPGEVGMIRENGQYRRVVLPTPEVLF